MGQTHVWLLFLKITRVMRGSYRQQKNDDNSSEDTPCLWADLLRESRDMSWADLEDTQVAPMVQVFVKSLTGKTVSVHARVSDTVGVIHTQVSHKLGVPVMFQLLIFRRQAAGPRSGSWFVRCAPSLESTFVLRLCGGVHTRRVFGSGCRSASPSKQSARGPGWNSSNGWGAMITAGSAVAGQPRALPMASTSP